MDNIGHPFEDSYLGAEDDDLYMPQSYLNSMRSPTKQAKTTHAPVQVESQDSQDLEPIILTELDVMLRDEVRDSSVSAILTELKPLIDHYKCAKRALAAVVALRYREKTTKSTSILFGQAEKIKRMKETQVSPSVGAQKS